MTPCIEWTGPLDGKGYGKQRIQGRLVGSHRLAFAAAHGPIPVGLDVLHRCDNPPCVNPDHLFLGTAADNARDMVAKGRQRNGRSARLTVAAVCEIRALGTTESASVLARRFGVSARSIYRVRWGRTWREASKGSVA
jgi:hypothetical protein